MVIRRAKEKRKLRKFLSGFDLGYLLPSLSALHCTYVGNGKGGSTSRGSKEKGEGRMRDRKSRLRKNVQVYQWKSLVLFWLLCQATSLYIKPYHDDHHFGAKSSSSPVSATHPSSSLADYRNIITYWNSACSSIACSWRLHHWRYQKQDTRKRR